jgi:hypothetical protein
VTLAQEDFKSALNYCLPALERNTRSAVVYRREDWVKPLMRR